MKPIVTDTYDFPTLVGNGYVYVDKTALLRRMISGVDGRFFFMSRPRRFGKSLMISTLEQIFDGNRELFKGLAIDKSDYDWKPYPVIRLDMSQIRAPDVAGCRRVLCALLADMGRSHSLDLSGEGNPAEAIGRILKSVFAMVPHDWKLRSEAEAKRYFLLFMKMSGAAINAEVESANGRADAVLETEKSVFIFEFKYGKSAKAALKQCHSRDYAAPYAMDKRRIVYVGVNYDTLNRNVDTLNDTLNDTLKPN